MHFRIMGIPGLTKGIKRIAPGAIIEMTYADVARLGPRKVYGVDVNPYLYPTQYNSSQKSDGNHIREFMEMIVTWAQVGVSLIPVFDGNTNTEEKRRTLEKRTEAKAKPIAKMLSLLSDIHAEEPIQELSSMDTSDINKIIVEIDLQSLAKKSLRSGKGTAEQRIELEELMDRNILSVGKDKYDDLINLFDRLGVTWFQAKGEADFLLAALYKNGYVDGVISEDCDMLTHGVGRLVRTRIPNLRRIGQASVYTLSTLLEESGLTQEQFIDLCILAGCDYHGKIGGIALLTGYKLLQANNDIPSIVEQIGTGKYKKYDLKMSKEEYLEKYWITFNTFNKDQEAIPEFTLPERLHMGDDFRDWVSANTNYGSDTLQRKLDILESFRVHTTELPTPLETKEPEPEPKSKPKMAIRVKTREPHPHPQPQPQRQVVKVTVKQS